MYSNSNNEQCNRAEAYIKKFGSDTTIDLRHKLDILMPATRIHELRHKRGLNIVTVWDVGINPDGGKHRIARYFLKPGRYKEVTQ